MQNYHAVRKAYHQTSQVRGVLEQSKRHERIFRQLFLIKDKDARHESTDNDEAKDLR